MKIRQEVDPNTLVITNPLLDKIKLRKMRGMSIESILDFGDIVVARCAASGVNYVVDGNHRVAVLKLRGVDSIPVVIGEEMETDPAESWAALMAY